jgi:hypothetical protein
MSDTQNVFHKQVYFKSLIFTLALLSGVIYSSQLKADGVHKGLNFKGLIKTASGEYLTRTGLSVNLKILSPNNCVLREEQYSNISMNEGSLQLVIGQGAVTGNALAEVSRALDNSGVSFTGLTCLNSDGSTDSNTTTYTSASQDIRKVRVSLNIDTIPVVGTFNLRAVAYAVNAESLDGKSKSDFIQVSNKVTQTGLEDFITKITAAAGNFIKWDGTQYIAINVSNFVTSLTSCSEGMTMVGTGRSAYCIDAATRSAATYLSANDTCRSLGYTLCSFNEWSYACSKAVDSTAFYHTDSAQWVSEPASNATSAMTAGGSLASSCISHSTSTATDGSSPLPFRCCAH